MAKYVALVRGINVGGRAKLAMADLKQVCADLGYTDIVTYVNSGNVVFSASSGSVASHASSIAGGIAALGGVAPPVVVRTAASLQRVFDANPYGDKDITKVAVTFLDAAPASASVEKLAALAERAAPDEFHLHGHELYLHCPTGFGTTKLTNTAIEKALGVTGTARNWKTVTKLVELTSQ